MTARLIGGEMMVWSDLDGKHGAGPVRSPALRPFLATASGRTLVAGPHDPTFLSHGGFAGEQITLLVRGVPDAERLAVVFADRPEVTVLAGSVDRLPAAPTYDTVIALDGLDRLRTAEDEPAGEAWADDLARLVAVLRPGGRLLLGLENLFGLHRILAVAPEPADTDWAAPGEYDPTRPAAPEQLRAALAAAGLEVLADYAAFPSASDPSVLLGSDLLADRARRGWATATIRSALAADRPAAGREAGPAVGSAAGREAGPAVGSAAGREAGPAVGSAAGREAGPAVGSAAGRVAGPDGGAAAGREAGPAGAVAASASGPASSAAGRAAPDRESEVPARVSLADPGRLAAGALRAGIGAELAPAWFVVAQRPGSAEPAPELPAAILPDGPVTGADTPPPGATLDELFLAASRRRDLPELGELLTAWQSGAAAGVPAEQIVVAADGTRTALVSPGEPLTALRLLAGTMIREGHAYLWPAPADEAELTALLAAMAGGQPVEMQAAEIPPGSSGEPGGDEVDVRELLMARDRLARELAEALAKQRWYETMLVNREAELKRVRRINTMLLATLPGKAAKATYGRLRAGKAALRRLKG